MFGSNKNQAVSNNNIGMIIGKDTHFKGTINSQEIVRIDGDFEGDVKTVDSLIIGETGRIKGLINAQNATIAGFCEGNLTIVGKLELLATAKLIGDIKTGSFVVSSGAIFQGTCAMPEKELPSPRAAEKQEKKVLPQ